MAKQPVIIPRKALYDRVWSTPTSRLAKEFGVSDKGLAKICKRANIPLPYRGYWARLHAGLQPMQAELPPGDDDALLAITPSPSRNESPIAVSIAAERPVIVSPDADLHPLVQAWLAGQALSDLTELERRRYEILNAIFGAVEPQGLTPDVDGRAFYFRCQGEKLSCRLDRAAMSVRGLTPDAARHLAELPDVKPVLRFTIETYFPPAHAIRRKWSDSNARRLEQMVADIIRTLLVAGHRLVSMKEERDERRRQQDDQRHMIQVDTERRSIEAKWTQALLSLAEQHRVSASLRIFLEKLSAQPCELSKTVAGRSLAEWLTWAHERVEKVDPINRGPIEIFEEIARAASLDT